jgi:hypothetical protein
MEKVVAVGDILYGYCNGFFGRDSYDDKIIMALGEDWVVARELNSRRPVFATFADWDSLNMQDMLAKWNTPGAP